MSVEAITWALNLAPVPADAGGKPNSACAFVLVGLANHADPDGTGAFPSAGTLVRYTRLSERTVRTALDRLQESGLIRPCAPEIIAARIRRADRRPQGWDLDLSQVRDDLDDSDIAALERQFPGLRQRVRAARTAPGGPGPQPARNEPSVPGTPVDNSPHGVQQVHPVAETPVDNRSGGVQRLHPAEGTGCNQFTGGVQLTQERGAAIAPEPSIEPFREPSAASARTRARETPADRPAGGGAEARFFEALGSGWLLTADQRGRLTPMVTDAVAAGWDPGELAAFVGANSAGVRSPYAVLAARLSPSELPVPRTPADRRTPWCGQCDPRTRFLLDEYGYPGDSRCPDCGASASSHQPAVGQQPAREGTGRHGT